MSSFGAVLDTCVLIQAGVRDTLLRAAEAGLFRVHWSDDILNEMANNLPRVASMTPAQIQKLVDQITEIYPEAKAVAYQGLVSSMPVNPKDRHVVAAAVATGSQVIVTFNLRDFPKDALSPYGIEPRHPDEFLTDLCDLNCKAMVRILFEQAADLRNPPKNFDWLLGNLEKTIPNFCAAIRKSLLIPGCE